MAMSLVLLFLITMVSVYTARTVLLEQKVAGNEFRAHQAFEAAESGLITAISYLTTVDGWDKDDDGVIDPVFDTDADGIGDTNSATFDDNTSVTVTITGAFPAFNIQSVGISDDLTASRTIRQLVGALDALPHAPDTPLTTRGTVTVDGSATIYNPEGHSTIWSGSDVELGANNSTATNIADPADPGYPGCMDVSMTCGTTRSSSKVAVGLDVIEHDSSLSNLTGDQMFRNFFGTSMQNYHDSRVTLEVAPGNANNLASHPANPGVHLGVGEVIWIDGDVVLDDQTTLGCEIALSGSAMCPTANTDPSVLIIDGDLTTNGTPSFYGIVYVTGSLNLSSNTTVVGAMIVGGNSATNAGGSLDIWYNSSVLGEARNNAPLAGAAGSWRDW
jgi:PilX N-terminal